MLATIKSKALPELPVLRVAIRQLAYASSSARVANTGASN
jgi:hypothetical protein